MVKKIGGIWFFRCGRVRLSYCRTGARARPAETRPLRDAIAATAQRVAWARVFD